jgi:outer membrane protein OmpA-like peptidoglycan-associated protein
MQTRILLLFFVFSFNTVLAQSQGAKWEAFRMLQYKIRTDVKEARWSSALAKVNIYQQDFADFAPYKEMCALLKAPTTGIQKEVLPGGVNSEQDENTPVLSADGKTIYFCSEDRAGIGLGGEDIFQAKLENGLWSAVSLIAPLSGDGNDAPLSVSADGTRLFIFVNGKIAYSDKTADSWTKPEFLPSPLNESDWQSDAQMTADGKALLLTIKNTETENRDIFISELQEDGSWGIPVNLGPTINTDWTERTPLLHPDMKTLYFSSNGHGGLGKLDVYKSTRQGDGWTQWSEPVNLGKEINTAGHDWGYSISTDGQYAVFSAAEGQQDDLYRIELPQEMRPESVTAISGKIEGLKAGKSANILLFDDEGTQIGTHRSDPTTGEYFIVLPAGISPTVKIEGEGIVSAPQKVEVQTQKEGLSEVTESINVVDLSDVGDEEVSFTFEDVLFATNKHELRPAFLSTLNDIATVMKEKGLKLVIEGHTDAEGSESYNQALSQKRAEAVADYLISKGCDQAKIIAKGFGESQPVSTNDTPEGRAKNRRVELKFSK